MMKPVPSWTPPHRRVLIGVCVLLVAANVFDAYHTLLLLGTHAQEANPIMRRLMAHDWTYVWILKIGVPVTVSMAVSFVILHPRAPARWRRRLWWALCLTTAFYAFIVANFVYIYLRILLSW